MAAVFATLALTLLTSKSAAWPTGSANINNKSCATFSMPISVTAHHHLYNIVHINNNIDATSYAVDLDTWDNSTIQDRIIGNITIARTYDIHMKLCVPSNGQKRKYLQLLTHGAGFDSRYWDPEFAPSNYSYVDATLAAGYSVLTYDRLGTGQSSHPDAYTEVQAPAEIEILRSITKLARSGQI